MSDVTKTVTNTARINDLVKELVDAIMEVAFSNTGPKSTVPGVIGNANVVALQVISHICDAMVATEKEGMQALFDEKARQANQKEEH